MVILNNLNKTKICLIIVLVFVLKFSTFGQQCDSCKKSFDKLLEISNKEKISQSDMENSLQITKKLYKDRYTDYIDSIVNKNTYESYNLTRTFTKICLKADGRLGVDSYLNYLAFSSGSAEEDRSFCFERIFVKFPEIVLSRIEKNNTLLDELVWGFLNNRLYGAKNQNDEDEFSSISIKEKSQTEVLNKDNCKSIFFETNPSLVSKYDNYRYQIDYIINNSIESLKDLHR
jgi:hypothetical protein